MAFGYKNLKLKTTSNIEVQPVIEEKSHNDEKTQKFEVYKLIKSKLFNNDLTKDESQFLVETINEIFRIIKK